ncbi:MAG: hypothetical protein M1815_006083 [Lichina confinis]|nr:MAG: hypothetical protein M1815_006083 [Lichina confinis]
MALRPLVDIQVSRRLIPRHLRIPNTSVQRRPLLIYHGVFASSTTASTIEAHLREVGVASPQWRYKMYSTTHFHSTTHEVLCVSRGRARLCFGGDQNPGRVEPVVQRGDAIVVPAGVGHRLLQDLDGDFEMVGAYPDGKTWDMCYGSDGEDDKADDIARVAWLVRDPFYGDEGPVMD